MTPINIAKAYDAIVIGTSAGGVEALNQLFRNLPANFEVPIIVVLHLGNDCVFLPNAFHTPDGIILREADEKDPIVPKSITFAPPGYHLLIEQDFTFSLSTEDLVNFSRPSIDVTFESAAEAYGERLLGIILTGANEDGAQGLKHVKALKGLTITQDPAEASSKAMPQAAIIAAKPHYIIKLIKIAELLTRLQDGFSINKENET